MTQTAIDTVRAFLNKDKINKGNTHTNGSELILFGHTIARYNDKDQICFSLCGWNTVTTKDRLNELLDQTHSKLRIRSKNYTPYLIKYDNENNIINSIEIDSSKEYILNEVFKNE